jgi:hypothetical protein
VVAVARGARHGVGQLEAVPVAGDEEAVEDEVVEHRQEAVVARVAHVEVGGDLLGVERAIVLAHEGEHFVP